MSQVKEKPKYNLVHTYVGGASFNNIFGGRSPTQFGSISHIQYMSPMMQYKWPWMKGMWDLCGQQGTIGYFKTLREAKAAAIERWPTCTFETPAQVRKRNPHSQMGDW